MKSKLLNETPKTFLLAFDKGDDVTVSLLQFAKENQLKASYFTALRLFQRCDTRFLRAGAQRLQTHRNCGAGRSHVALWQYRSRRKRPAQIARAWSDRKIRWIGARRAFAKGTCLANGGIISDEKLRTIAAER